jgi:DNA-binding Xre family transcriptional regulator
LMAKKAFPKRSGTPPGAKASPAKSPKSLKGRPPAEGAPVELQIIFGENFRAARLRRGLRQSDVTELTGMKQQYLSQIELGLQNITLKTVELLAQVVDCEPSDMIRRANHAVRKK